MQNSTKILVLSCLVFCNFILADINLQDKTTIFGKTLYLNGSAGNLESMVINNTPVFFNPDRTFRVNLAFEQLGKNLVVIQEKFRDGNNVEKKYKVLVLKTFRDAPDKPLYSEMAALGLFSGYADDTLKPGVSISPEDACSIVALSKGLKPNKGEAVAKLIDAKIIPAGLSEKFRGVKLTRAAALALICQVSDLEPKPFKGKLRFKDISAESWYYPYVVSAESQGWLDYITLSQLFPEANISRGEFLVLLSKTNLLKQKLEWLRDWEEGYDRAASPRVFTRRLMSVVFEDMELKNILQLLAKEGDLNIVLGSKISGKVSGRFKDVYPETILESVLQSLDYSVVLEGNIYRIVKNEKKEQKKYSRVKEYKINYAEIDKVKDELIKLIPSLKDKILLSRETNSILVKTSHPEQPLINDIVERLDAPPLQVMVEAKIFEVNAEESSKLGSKFFSQSDNGRGENITIQNDGLQPDNPPVYIRKATNDSNLYAFIAALESKSNLNMLSTPRVIAVNNREAVLETRSEVAYQDETVSYPTSVEVISRKIIFKNIGTSLKFIPHINENGYITVDLYPEISTSILDVNTNSPLVQSTRVHTQVIVKDGETFLIGGLLRDSEETVQKKVPFLADIPLLGELFKRSEKTLVKKEVIIMITPTIMKYME